MNSNIPVNARAVSARWGMPIIPAHATVLPRLQGSFDSWIEGEGILVVNAPVGFGKSTQVAAWLAGRPAHESVIWIGASSFVTTWADAQYALLNALIDLGLVEARAGADGDERSLVEVHLALQRLTTRVIVVFDDADSLLPTIQLEVADAEARSFPLVRAVYIASHDLPQVPDRADPARVTVTRDDLAWPLEFAIATVDALRGTETDAGRLREVVDATEGRASAILNLAQSIGNRTFGLPEGYRAMWTLERADYMDDSGRTAALLRLLSNLVEAPLGLLAEFGFADIPEMLPALRRKGFVETIGADPEFPEAIRMTPADRVALAEHLGTDRADGGEVHARAAAYFLRAGRSHLALLHLAKSRQYAAAVAELKKPWSESNPIEELMVIREALAELPVPVLASDPEALALRVISGLLPPLEPVDRMGDAQSALLLLPPAEVAAMPLRGRILVITATMTALLYRGRAAEAIARGLRLADTLRELPWERLYELGRTPGLFWTVLAESELIEGRVRGALVHATLAVDWNRELGHPYAAYRAVTTLSAALALEGDTEASVARGAQAQRVREEAAWGDTPTLYTSALAELFNSLGRLDADATAAAARSFHLLAVTGESWLIAATVAEAYALLIRGELKDAFGLSSSALARLQSGPAPMILHHLATGLHADVLLAMGRPGTVLSLLSSVHDGPDHSFCYSGRAAVAHLSLGDASSAIVATERCIEVGMPHVRRTLSNTLLVRAAAQEQRGLERAADATFADALIMQRHGARAGAFFNVDPALLAPIWTRLQHDDPHLYNEYAHFANAWLGFGGASASMLLNDALSEREREVLAVLGGGGSYREMGEQLYLSANTVKTHLSSIYRKLGVGSRREALDIAQELGLQTGSVQRAEPPRH